jgi:hypothetical protein
VAGVKEAGFLRDDNEKSESNSKGNGQRNGR